MKCLDGRLTYTPLGCPVVGLSGTSLSSSTSRVLARENYTSSEAPHSVTDSTDCTQYRWNTVQMEHSTNGTCTNGTVQMEHSTNGTCTNGTQYKWNLYRLYTVQIMHEKLCTECIQ